MVSNAGQPSDAVNLSDEDRHSIEQLKGAHDRLRNELGKIIVGQSDVIEHLLVAIFAQGHCLLEGVPGLAKTLMVSSLARALALDFARIQFTPDLMPSDITGTEVIQDDRASGERTFRFLQGPIFRNIVLADEINRTPPKTQAALLEAMQERQVTIGGTRHKLPGPFFVLATQNPIEQEGTYTLPEAQQDRFMFKIFVDYPSYDEEFLIAESTTADRDVTLEPVLGGEEILRLQRLVRRVPVSPYVIHYALRLVRATRVQGESDSAFVKENVAWGAGPRGVQYLLLGAKARAMLDGRYFVTIDDVRSVARPVLRHRVITNFNAESRGINSDRVIDQLVTDVPERSSGDEIAPQLATALA
ncbi:MAG: MoxR family ATPase [Planctomycetales bacterium]|nr:MoxR family ATPase [Planctomycetales bacterium]